jgi:hypothetical protein
MESIITDILTAYGPLGVCMAAGIYILLRGRFVFEYPRDDAGKKGKDKDDSKN